MSIATETELERRTREIREAEDKSADQEEITQRQKYFHAMIKLRNNFEESFKEVLPMLAEAGINYTAHRQNARYSHMSSYIKFDLAGKSLKMDFTETGGWRYEFVPYSKDYGTMCYGEWPMDRFIVWITENLLKK